MQKKVQDGELEMDQMQKEMLDLKRKVQKLDDITDRMNLDFYEKSERLSNEKKGYNKQIRKMQSKIDSYANLDK